MFIDAQAPLQASLNQFFPCEWNVFRPLLGLQIAEHVVTLVLASFRVPNTSKLSEPP